MRRPWPLVLHSALWAVLGLAFLYRSAPHVVRSVVRYNVGPIHSLHSFDLFLRGVDNAPTPSQRVLRMFSLLPKDRRVVIFTRENEEGSALLGMAMAYLAWPHQVEVISCSERVAEERIAAIPPQSVSALIFCKIKQPDWLPEGLLCARDVRVVCVAEL